MAIRREFRWWILTVVVVGLLLFISALALDRPDVVWEEGRPHCPHCRSEVGFYSTRCRTCAERYDWSVAPDDISPYSHWSLGALEVRRLRDFVEARGREVAIDRVEEAFGIPHAAATAYLEHVGRGRCGYCGGTGRDLSAFEAGVPCPVCFGRGACIACGGDRRVRIGDEAAHRALLVYEAGVQDVRDTKHVSEAVRVEEVRRLAEKFLSRHAGTIEASRILFWPDWPSLKTAADSARERLDRLFEVLEAE